MAKKKKKSKKQHSAYRNAGPRVAREAPIKPGEETPLKRLVYTAGGAAGASMAGAFLTREGWAPKTIATALTAVGAGLGWKGDAPGIRSVGSGVMSAAGGQLALMMIDDQDRKAAPAAAHSSGPAKKPANASNALPPGALESALSRAQARLALSARESEA
jgi:hypothetical protein